MSENETKIYRYDDKISFRQCTLANQIKSQNYGDCTNFCQREENFKQYFDCNQYGIHLHCTIHPNIEYNICYAAASMYLKCSKCNELVEIEDFNAILQRCMKMINSEKFKNAKLIRLDDWYIPEVKEKIELENDYWVKIDVKTDKDSDTIIVLYVGKKNSNEKAQFFIKPEKLQLSNDYKDLDPASVLSKIEVTLRDRTIKQEYE